MKELRVDEFGIDDQELKDLSPETAFRLGVEWKTFRDECVGVHPFWTYVRSDNAQRLIDVAVRYGRTAKKCWINDDLVRLEVSRPNG